MHKRGRERVATEENSNHKKSMESLKSYGTFNSKSGAKKKEKKSGTGGIEKRILESLKNMKKTKKSKTPIREDRSNSQEKYVITYCETTLKKQSGDQWLATEGKRKKVVKKSVKSDKFNLTVNKEEKVYKITTDLGKERSKLGQYSTSFVTLHTRK